MVARRPRDMTTDRRLQVQDCGSVFRLLVAGKEIYAVCGVRHALSLAKRWNRKSWIPRAIGGKVCRLEMTNESGQVEKRALGKAFVQSHPEL